MGLFYLRNQLNINFEEEFTCKLRLIAILLRHSVFKRNENNIEIFTIKQIFNFYAIFFLKMDIEFLSPFGVSHQYLKQPNHRQLANF